MITTIRGSTAFPGDLPIQLSKDIHLFQRTRALENEIDEFLDKLSQSSLMFKIAVSMYLSDGYTPDFKQKLQDVDKMESGAIWV